MGSLSTVRADRPLGYWPLDEAPTVTTVADRSGNGRDCTWADGTRAAKSFFLDRAGDLDGSDHVRTSATVAAFDLAGTDVSFEMWIKYTSTGGIMSPFIVRNDDGTNGGTLGGLLLNNGTAGEVQLYDGSSVLTSWSGGLNDDRWHHIVGVVPTGASKTHIIYADGLLRASAVATRWAFNAGARRMCIGGNWNPPFGGGSLQRYTGQLAHFALYAEALSLAKVRAHYFDGIGTLPAPSPLRRRRR